MIAVAVACGYYQLAFNNFIVQQGIASERGGPGDARGRQPLDPLSIPMLQS